MNHKIVYTHTDEAPALATRSLLPIIQAFTGACDIPVEIRDISLAGRIIARFPKNLTEEQKIGDALTELGELTQQPEANIIKLPNISASLPQLQDAIAELQANGYDIPDYPEDPVTDNDREIRARYDKIKGSAVNPVLREGNSDRRAPKAVKQYARNNPHSMGIWSPDSQTHVATMTEEDFRNNEESVTMPAADQLRIELINNDGGLTVLKESVAVQSGEIVDASLMSKKHLLSFLKQQVADARTTGVLYSVHLKATMMKVSDPIIFGHAVRTYFRDAVDHNADALNEAGVNLNNGLGDLFEQIKELPEEDRAQIEADFRKGLESGPDLAMVDSDKGITNLHVPSDIIIDASMPAMIRNSGKMWNKDGKTQDTKAVIPDSSYAGLYEAVIEDCIKHGAFDPTTMGTVPNVGLMAQKAEEYGSHDKTFEIPVDGRVRVLNQAGDVILDHVVEEGDIWRLCQVKDAAVRDWVKLAVTRARATGWPAVFWLDADREHDAELIKKVKTCLPEHDTTGMQIEILSPVEAMKFSLERIRLGENTISVTGNVLRDYLTDLFPILELGTSAKMLSIVPLMKGGGLFETGAGGSAPKHVQQFQQENHLRWDSLGEFMALAVSLEHFADATGNQRAKELADALDQATGKLLETGKSPSRKVNELDNRGSHFYLALYWAQAMAEQTGDAELQARFATLADELAKHETEIVDELNSAQGQPMDIGGYFFPDSKLAAKAMRPSETFNSALNAFSAAAVS
ncbi:MAG: NADP-dependent isocitrate dehydrogenase [Pirellulaceae bacterium]